MRIITRHGLLVYVDFVKDNNLIGGLDLENQGKRVCIWNFYIKPEFRNNGLGKSFFQRVVNYINHRELWLYVDKANQKAIKIYESTGFKITGNFGKNCYSMMYTPRQLRGID